MSVQLEWRYVPGRGRDHPKPLIRAWCEECEQYSRAVRTPNEAEREAVWEAAGRPLTVTYPAPPRGWENGCPRCDR